MTKLYKTLLEELGLTYPQYLALLVLWERDGAAGHHRSLLQEVDFFQDLGMAVYLVGATRSAAAEEDVELGPVLRVHPQLYYGEGPASALLRRLALYGSHCIRGGVRRLCL